MAAKLRINLAEGTFEAEGEDEFVKAMHSEFQDYVGRFFGERATRRSPELTPPADEIEDRSEEVAAGDDLNDTETGARVKRNPVRRRRVSNSSETAGTKKLKYEPRVDPDLKLPGLVEAFSSYELKGHKDMVLFFAHYLSNDAGIVPFTADHIFTCYRIVKEKPPTAFAQALYDARKVRHFIKFEKLDAIYVTHIGDTAFEHDLKKKD